MSEAQRTLDELADQLEAAISITMAGNRLLNDFDANAASVQQREKVIVELQGQLNTVRGFDCIFMGC